MNPHDFVPPPFVPHRLVRGGHLQTVVSPRLGPVALPAGSRQTHRIELPGGDAIIAHDDFGDDWKLGDRVVVLLHGITGCHGSAYQRRFAGRLVAAGMRTLRVDLRGCGSSRDTCREITHAGRADDVAAALSFAACRIGQRLSPVGAVGVSLGGNQLLLAAGQIGGGRMSPPAGWDHVDRLLALAPPVDLQSCADRMELPGRRFYNRYFIRNLVARASDHVRGSEPFVRAASAGWPKTLAAFDRAITAPLAGFDNERAYYAACSAGPVMASINVPTLIVAAADDPLVPIESIRRFVPPGHARVRLLELPTGGHHGFVGRRGAGWSDDLVQRYFVQP